MYVCMNVCIYMYMYTVFQHMRLCMKLVFWVAMGGQGRLVSRLFCRDYDDELSTYLISMPPGMVYRNSKIYSKDFSGTRLLKYNNCGTDTQTFDN